MNSISFTLLAVKYTQRYHQVCMVSIASIFISILSFLRISDYGFLHGIQKKQNVFLEKKIKKT